MSKIIASSAIRGAHAIVRDAEDILARAIAAKGGDCAGGLSGYGLLAAGDLLAARPPRGQAVGHAAGARGVPRAAAAGSRRQSLAALSRRHARRRRGHAVRLRDDRGLQVSDRAESGGRHLAGRGQRRRSSASAASSSWTVRRRASPPSWAPPRPCEDAVRIARELQEKNLYVFMAGHTNGVSFAEQLAEAGVQTRLGDAPGALRQGDFGRDLRARLRQPRGAQLRRRASRATTRAI